VGVHVSRQFKSSVERNTRPPAAERAGPLRPSPGGSDAAALDIRYDVVVIARARAIHARFADLKAEAEQAGGSTG